MRRVLVVAYYFPPLGGAGVQRTLKFVKYLPQFGWQPHVLTVHPPPHSLTDETLAQELPPSLPVVRTHAWILPRRLPFRARSWISRWLLLVDEQLGWLPFAVPAAMKVCRQASIDAVYTSSAPYTDHLIGRRVKQRTGLPWIADFRDPWVENFSNTFATPIHRRLAAALQRQVFQTADRVILNTPTSLAFYRQQYPHLPPERLAVIPNGYDIPDLEGPPLPAGETESRKMRIVYAGSLYGQRQTGQYFLGGLRRAIDTGLVEAGAVHVDVIGNVNPSEVGLVDRFNLGDLVQIHGYTNHKESVAWMKSADLLLLILGAGPNSELVLPGKIFEYLAVRKPVLALAGPGAVADLVNEARAGWVVDSCDVEAIAQRLGDIFHLWKRTELAAHLNEEVIARYDRRRLTQELSQLMDAVVGQRQEAA